MKIDGNAIRPGYVLEHRDRLWMVVRAEHVKPGKGPAYQQVELKDLVDGTKLNERFRAAETVERVRLEEKEYQFLYEDDGQLNLMDQETFEQTTIDQDLLADSLPFLQEGMTLTVQAYEGRPLMARLPETTVLDGDRRPIRWSRARPRPPRTSRRCSRTACGSWCRRTSRRAPGWWSTSPRRATSSAPETDDGDRPGHGAPFRQYHRDDPGRTQGGAAAGARFRRGREPAGLDQGAGRFRQRGRPARRADPAP